MRFKALNRRCHQPSMKPVLTNITLDHETCDIVRKSAQAIHWNGGHAEDVDRLFQHQRPET